MHATHAHPHAIAHTHRPLIGTRMHKHRHHLTLAAAMLLATTLSPATAQTTSAATTAAKPPSAEQTRAEITMLLNDFLKPGSNDKAETHERFWADDLVYTSAMGVVRSKADILKSFKPSDAKPAAGSTTAAPAAPTAPTVFSAEDIVVRPYSANGDVAALTFRLVTREANGATTYYRNSGTFLWRGGRWQAVTWQATKVGN
jgi:Domain of unknown function (DUF4440)